MNLTPEQINIAIAEFCGWRRDPNATEPWVWIMPNGKAWETSAAIPNYHGDLNACREAEEMLDEKQRGQFASYLWDLMLKTTKRNPWWLGPYKFELIHASAPQRCEALLKTIGKLT